MPELEISLPDGKNFKIEDRPGITYIIGANGVGKSFGFKDLIQKSGGSILYVPPNREQMKHGYTAYSRNDEKNFNPDWQAVEMLGRLWSRAIRQSTIRAMAQALLERLGVPQRIEFEVEGGQVRPYTKDLGQTYDARRESSGLLNLPTMGAALYDPTYKTVIIDEPEQSLHPQAQHQFLQIVRDLAEKHQRHFVIITHSPTMIEIPSAEYLSACYFIRRPSPLSTDRIVNSVPSFDSNFYEDALPGLNSYKREAFFADNVIIVEGVTDRDFLKTLLVVSGYGSSLGKSTILPADGHGLKAKYYSLMNALGVRPILILDSDVVLPTSGVSWTVGNFKDESNWKGWVSPTQYANAIKSKIITPDIEAFIELEQKATELKELLKSVLEQVMTSTEAELAGVPSIGPADLKAQKNRHVIFLRLFNSALKENDWANSKFKESFEKIIRCFKEFQTEASNLHIIILDGDLETYYRNPQKSEYKSKAEKSFHEIKYMMNEYKKNSAKACQNYEWILNQLQSKGLLLDSSVKIPHEATAAICGKFCEIYHFVFGGSDSSTRIEQLKTNDKLLSLSPEAKIKAQDPNSPAEWFEVELPLLKGFLNPTGTFRFERGAQPDVFELLAKE